MTSFWRSFFGLETSTRTVSSHPAAADARAVQYIRSSNARLNALHNLHERYKDTPHAAKILAVFEKTKNIHNYLVTRKRVHELEMFHVRNTEHFLNTFTTIINVHQRHTADTFVPAKPAKEARKVAPAPRPKEQPRAGHASKHFESKVENVLKRIESETIKGIYTAHKVSEMVKRVKNQTPMGQADVLRAEVPGISIPAVAIDTYSRVHYAKEIATGGTVSREIGFTSSDEDKEAFLQHVAFRLGLDKAELSYIGNAMMAIPDTKGPSPARHVPVMHWRGFPYVLSLIDYRLFPVRMHRQSF
jgi:hypothetical protein